MKHIRNVYIGALAGLAGGVAMQHFRLMWNARSSVRDGVFGLDDEADLKSVCRLLPDRTARNLSREDALKIALALHYSYAAVAGAAYGTVRGKTGFFRGGFGTSFGVALWLVGDELAMTVTGLSDPRTRSARSHGSALFAHLLFATTTELAMGLAEKLFRL